MKYFVTLCVALTMVSCAAQPRGGTTTHKKVATTVVFRELPITLDLPSVLPSPMRDMKKWKECCPTIISTVSDKLLAGFGDPVGFLKNPLYNNWKTMGPLHISDYAPTLVEVSFDGSRPIWFSYELIEEILGSAGYENLLGLHDLANLVSKYGDVLPADTPIVGFASVTAYYDYGFMSIGKKIQSPAVIKTKGKWDLWDLRILYDRSFPDYPYHPPLFLVDVDKKDRHQPLPKVKIFLNAENASKP